MSENLESNAPERQAPSTTKTAGEWLGELDLLLKRINNKTAFFKKYAAVSDSSKVDIASTVDSLRVNLQNAKSKVESEYKSMEDLIKRYLVIRAAIDLHNVTKRITVNGESYSIATGMAILKHIVSVYDKLNSNIAHSISAAKQDVNSTNVRLSNVSEKAKDTALAEIQIFIKPAEIESLGLKSSELSLQIKNAIKYANNSTSITIFD
jgi:S-adenosylmethionine synthetase